MIHNPQESFITDGKEFFISFTTPLVTGYMPVPIPRGDPVLRWSGPKIHYERTWLPVLRFMEDHAEHEVVLRLFIPPDRAEIIVFPLSQIYGTGMTVKEEVTREERDWWAAEGLLEAGTVHSHCSGGAFQSGVDKSDEARRDGLHLTIGKLKSDQFDIHSRMTWTLPGEEENGKLIRASVQTTQPPVLTDWFEFPLHVYTFIEKEPELEQSVVKYMLVKPPPKEVSYPPAWKEKLIRKTTPTGAIDMDHGRFYQSVLGHAEFSHAQDIPGHGSEPPSLKKKESRSNNRNDPNIQKDNLIWDMWSEVLSLIADSGAMRSAGVSVSDFEPDKRPILIRQVPAAAGVWEQIQSMLRANNVSEEEFFKAFGS